MHTHTHAEDGGSCDPKAWLGPAQRSKATGSRVLKGWAPFIRNTKSNGIIIQLFSRDKTGQMGMIRGPESVTYSKVSLQLYPSIGSINRRNQECVMQSTEEGPLTSGSSMSSFEESF